MSEETLKLREECEQVKCSFWTKVNLPFKEFKKNLIPGMFFEILTHGLEPHIEYYLVGDIGRIQDWNQTIDGTFLVRRYRIIDISSLI